MNPTNRKDVEQFFRGKNAEMINWEIVELVERLKVHRKRSGRIDTDVADGLNRTYYSLTSEVEVLESQEMTQGHILGRTPIFRDVRTRLKDLGNNVSKLNEAMERQTEAIMEKDPYHKPTRRLRDAVREVDKKLAKSVSLKDLDEWMVNFFLVNWEDPRTLQRVAKVYVLAQIPLQTWELRYRSDSPGRPLLLLAETSDFPDIEFLESYEANYGHHDEYYIAARFPSWRIVWKTSWF